MPRHPAFSSKRARTLRANVGMLQPMRIRSAPACLGVIMLLAAPAGVQAQPSNIRLWRITELIPEPWTDSASLPASAHELVRAGLAFLDDQVKGPAPLACEKPEYHERPVSVGELFAGRVSDDKLGKATRKLGIGEVEPFAFQVVCGSQTTSYFAFGVDRLVRVGEAIYRLHPRDNDSGVEPDEWVKRITPGFDCDKARTTAEKLICSDEETAAADRTVSERYAALRAEETPESFATVQASQRAWLKFTPSSCRADGAMPQDEIEQRDMVNCLREAYTGWKDAFESLSVERAGGLGIEPRLHIIAGLHPRQRLDWIAYPWMTGAPAATAAAFN